MKPIKRRWNLTVPQNQVGVPDPYGYVKTSHKEEKQASSSKDGAPDASTDNKQLQEKKAWEIAQAPFKGLFMTGFLMWMSGNQVNIFPIIITVMALINPIKALFAVGSVFQSFEKEGVPVLLPKIVYFLLNCVGLGIALFKCNSMGLLPQASDFAYTTPLQPQEFSVPIQM